MMILNSTAVYSVYPDQRLQVCGFVENYSSCNCIASRPENRCEIGVSRIVPLTPQLVRRQTLTDFRFAGCARNSSRKSKCQIAVESVVDDTLEG